MRSKCRLSFTISSYGDWQTLRKTSLIDCQHPSAVNARIPKAIGMRDNVQARTVNRCETHRTARSDP